MKIKNYSLLLTAIFFTAFTAERKGAVSPTKSNWQAMNLRGKIKAMCECDFDATAKADVISKLSETPKSIDSTWFDAKGNKIKQNHYNPDGTVLSASKYKYDSAENMLESVLTAKGKILHREVYAYDEKGNVSQATFYKAGDTLLKKDTYKYDENGNEIEKDEEENAPVKKVAKHYYPYDANGNKVKENVFTSGGSLNQAHAWKYDMNGRMVEEDNFTNKGTPQDKFVYKYDDQGNNLECDAYHADGSLSSKQTFKYNLKGLKIEEDDYNFEGKLVKYYTYGYDDKGNEKEYKMFNIYGNDKQMDIADTYLFEYDKKGNWIKKTDLKIDGAIVLTEREIMYY